MMTAARKREAPRRDTPPIPYLAGANDNCHAYVDNDPINRNDPSGMEQEIVVTGKRLQEIVVTSRGDYSFDWGFGRSTWTNYILYGSGIHAPRSSSFGGITVKGSRPRRFKPPSVTAPSLDPYSFFHHWDAGRGERVCLTRSQFDSVVRMGRWRAPSSGNGSSQINFYGTMLENSFGVATLRFRGGRPIGFHDRYDMGRATHRSDAAELRTTIGRVIGSVIGATDFDVVYPCD